MVFARLNSINDSILLTDLPVILAAEEMVYLVFSEQLYSRRYAIFRTQEVMNLLQERNTEFKIQLKDIRAVPEERDFPVRETAALHERYVSLWRRGWSPSLASAWQLSPGCLVDAG